jgi:hypothetical protein
MSLLPLLSHERRCRERADEHDVPSVALPGPVQGARDVATYCKLRQHSEGVPIRPGGKGCKGLRRCPAGGGGRREEGGGRREEGRMNGRTNGVMDEGTERLDGVDGTCDETGMGCGYLLATNERRAGRTPDTPYHPNTVP